MRDRVIGIIGFGNMGSAIAGQLKGSYRVFAFDKDKNKTKNLSGIEVVEGIVDLLNKTDTLILAVKPQDFDAVLPQIKDYLKDRLIISIAAGVTTGYIENFLGKVKIVRVMPNIAAKIGKAESALCKGGSASDEDLKAAKEIFDCIGKTWVMREEMINAATAISGSGPAYIYYDMEIKKIDPSNVPEGIEQEYIKRLEKAAQGVGFDSQTAIDLAVSTTSSTLRLTKITGIPPAELKKQISSKGGTTEAALKILAGGGSWEEAARAALKRAKELSKTE